jgi:hypothetical protein
MPTYPLTIRRCQHIKVNGIQCGSPAKRDEMHCFFHDQCRFISSQPKMKFVDRDTIKLPNLEDANSIQLALAEVMRLILTYQIDDRIASLLLRALRAAAANVRFTSLEPKPTRIVIDPKCVENRPLGATAWSTVEGQEFDMVADPNDGDNKDEEEPDSEKEERFDGRLGRSGQSRGLGIQGLWAAGNRRHASRPRKHPPQFGRNIFIESNKNVANLLLSRSTLQVLRSPVAIQRAAEPLRAAVIQPEREIPL